MAKPLRAVSPDERPPAKRQSVAEAAKSGTHRELLVAMRDRIAETVTKADCPPRDLASLTRRLQDIAKEIASIDAQASEDSAEHGDYDESYDSAAI